MKFKNFDLVKWEKKPGAWTVHNERPAARLYHIQHGTDTATREWANEDDLELIHRPESEPPAGFHPSEPLIK